MPLYKNTNQPYFLDPNSPANINCLGEYCYPIAVGDAINQQWYQTPCGNNEIADPLFSNATYGSDLVTNGTFTGSLAGWTAVAWTYNTNQAEAPALTAVNSLTQTIVAINGITYFRVTFDISGLSPGDSVRLKLGSTGYYEFDQNGSYDELIRNYGVNDDLVFFVPDTNISQALVDNVTLREATFGDWDTNDVWSINVGTGLVCASSLGTGLLEESVVDYIVAGDLYSLTFTVSNYVSGTVTPYIADQAGDPISANGTYTIYKTPTLTGVVSFLPSADFTGCISFPPSDDPSIGLYTGLRALRNDFQFLLVPQDGSEGEELDFSYLVEYYNEFVTVNTNIFDLLDVDYGCYTMWVTDMCLVEGVELVQNGTFAAADLYWTQWWGAHQYDFSGGEVTFIFEPLEGSNLLTNGDFSAGGAGWTATGWTIGTGATHNTGNTSSLSRTDTIPYVVGLRTWLAVTISGRTAGSFTVTLGDWTSSSYSLDGTFVFRGFQGVGGAITYSINPTSTFDGTVDDLAIHQTTNIWDESPVIQNPVNVDIVAGNYQFSYDITAHTGVVPTVANSLWGVASWLFGQPTALVFEDTIATHIHTISNYVPGQKIPAIAPSFAGIDSAGGQRSYPGRFTVDNVSLVRVEPFEATYISECFNFQLEHPNTQLITGYSDQEAFGFEFANTGFRLQMRVPIRSYNPFQEKTKNVAQYGTGNAAVTYAAKTKKWVVTTDFMSESAHDALGTIIDCDHFMIGTTGSMDNEYIADIEDYTPEWRSEGDYGLSITIFNVRLKEGGQLFNRHI